MLRNSINLGQSIWRDMMVLNKSAVKKLFNKDGVQVNVLALNYIDDWVQGNLRDGRKRSVSKLKKN